MNCKNCGSPLIPGQRFCNACGTPCDVVPAAPATPEVPVQPVTQSVAPTPVVPTQPVAPAAPVAPAQPVVPAAPVAPAAPVVPAAPVAPAPVPVEQNVVAQQPAAPVVPEQVVAPAPVAPQVQVTPPPAPTEEKKKKGGNIGFILIVLLLIAIICFLAKFMIGGDDKKDDTGNKNTTTTTLTTNTSTTTTTTTTTTTKPTTTSTTAAIAQAKYEVLYGFRFKVPSGYESLVENDMVVMYNSLLKRQVVSILGSGTNADLQASMETFKTNFINQGATNVVVGNGTHGSGVQYFTLSYTFQGHTYTDYFMEKFPGVIYQGSAFYTDVVGEEPMKELVFQIFDNIESPTDTFAGNVTLEKNFKMNANKAKFE